MTPYLSADAVRVEPQSGESVNTKHVHVPDILTPRAADKRFTSSSSFSWRSSRCRRCWALQLVPMPSPTKGASSPDRTKLIEASFRALEEWFNEYSALPNADVAGAKASAPPWPPGSSGGKAPAPPAPGTGGPKAKSGADFKVSKRIMNEVSYVNQHRQPKGVEVSSTHSMRHHPNPSPNPTLTLTPTTVARTCALRK